jgi:hypothetical protein
MLTAQKENNPLETQPLPQRPPTMRSIDRMVNSIEGLRERVEGFTLEQLSEVEQRLRAMSRRLGELQRTLKALAEIKQRIIRLQKAVAQAEAEILEQSRLATLAEPIAVQSIAHVGRLLKFRRVIKLLKEAKSVSGVLKSADPQVRTLVVPKPFEIVPEPATNEPELAPDLPSIEHKLPERSANQTPIVAPSEAQDESAAVFRQAATKMDFEFVLPQLVETVPEPATNEPELAPDLGSIEYELSERSANETPVDVTREDLEQTEAILHPDPAEAEFDSNEPFSNESTDVMFFDDNTASIHRRGINAEFEDTREEPQPSYVAALTDTDSGMDEAIFEEFKGTGNMEAHLAIPETETVETTVQTHEAASEEADFDQRLLDDLIKDYGEFTILPGSTPRREAKKEPKLELITPERRVEASATVNPASQQNLPLQRKDGELDRKLKKLIKDYGEYDLYSRQTPLKLKTGVVAAFLVLTLIFSGFYFFSSSKSAAPVNASSASPSQSSSDTASKKTSSSGETTSGETFSAPSVSNVDTPKTVEAGTSNNLADKATAKKTK